MFWRVEASSLIDAVSRGRVESLSRRVSKEISAVLRITASRFVCSSRTRRVEQKKTLETTVAGREEKKGGSGGSLKDMQYRFLWTLILPRERSRQLPSRDATANQILKGRAVFDVRDHPNADTQRLLSRSASGIRTCAPTMTEPLSFEDAQRRIDEISEVTQPAISPPGSDYTSALGARKWAFNFEEQNYYRASEVVWSPSHSPYTIQT